ncbi:MAG: NHLP bacteriocin export ABC transporter permease/ATPase subunit [Actinomycetota bacterium]|nr:NHLP bacteriocin export ABC transporter permease/ATPase subunit [Actinomycetota bacterium]
MTVGQRLTVPLGANRSVVLDDAASAHVVESGHVLVFAVEGADGLGQRHLLATLEPGDLVLGAPATAERPLSLLVTGAGAAALAPVRLADLLAGALEGLDPAAAIESWVTAISARLARNRQVPTGLGLLVPGGQEMAAGASLHLESGVRFVRCTAGLLALVGAESAAIGPGDAPLPLADEAWVRALDESRVEVLDAAALEGPACAESLRRFNELALTVLADEVAALRHRRSSEALRLQDADVASQERAVDELARVLSAPSRVDVRPRSSDPAAVAVSVVLAELGSDLAEDEPALARLDRSLPADERVRAAARIGGARTRTVGLPPDWWRQELGPIIGYRRIDGEPVALVRGPRRYRVCDPIRREMYDVDAAVAAGLGDEAVSLYRPLAEEARSIGALIRQGLSGSGWDLAWLLVFGSFAGIASLITPILTGKIFNEMIPGDERGRLGIAVLTLGLVAVSVAFGSLARGVAFIRIRARFSNRATSALWDRLLRLPAGFFGKHLVGALSNRARSVEMAQQILSDGIVATVLNGIFSLFNIYLLAAAGGALFWVGTGLVVFQLAAIVLVTLFQTRLTRRQIAAQNRAQSLSLQLIRGINKLRVAAAERRGFATWARRFTDQSRAAYRSGRLGAGLSVFTTAWPSLTTLAVTGVVATTGLGAVSVGSYIEFTTALAQVTGALIAMVAGLSTIAVVVPLLELPRPILEAKVEVGGGREQPGVLSGSVEVSHVSFRYSPDGPFVLDDVSIEAAPGEFIAIVGPSGAGKSSLVRLLLGFETPELGSVVYDGSDLGTLDTAAVRRQIGTVIQSARLLPGTIFSNIAGGLPITRDEAWAAAEAAGVAADIRAMPMGMETVIVEGGGVVSGGQRQRILIARALALKPRILLFDEATSALDNITQAIVTESVSRLQVTRVVIAHRLSTVQGADRIYVLERGRLVESGSYDALMARDGVFRRLALRQLV